MTWNCTYRQSLPVKGADATENTRFNFRKGGYQEMKQKLSEVNWAILEDLNVKDAWNFIKEKVSTAVKLFVP